MKKRMLLIVAGAALFILGYVAGHSPRRVFAQASISAVPIPQSYGHCVGAYVIPGSFVGLVFEDASRTVRVVNATDGKAETAYPRN